jgi:hypothetical protein
MITITTLPIVDVGLIGMLVVFGPGASFTRLASLLNFEILVTSLARAVDVQGSPTLTLALQG